MKKKYADLNPWERQIREIEDREDAEWSASWDRRRARERRFRVFKYLAIAVGVAAVLLVAALVYAGYVWAALCFGRA